MPRAHSTILSFVAVTAIAATASAHAVHEQRENLRAERELTRLTSGLASLAFAPAGDGRLSINGAEVRVQVTTAEGPVERVLRDVERDCRSGDYATALGGDPGEARSRPIALERVVSQEGEGGVRASLCIFAGSKPAGDAVHEPLRRVRYTLAHELADGRISIATVVNESTSPLADLFPADGDAPGSDSPDVARPAESRRLLTAAVARGGYVVRVYQTSHSVAAAMTSYDAEMVQRGYATTGTLPTARMYRRDGKSFVVSFNATTSGSNVAIAPFETED